mgnify:CR=1 FL=1
MAHLLAIAASPAGPAHSFMIGEALQAAATTLGHTLVLQAVSYTHLTLPTIDSV